MTSSDSHRAFYDALRSVLSREKLATDLMKEASTQDAARELGISQDMASDLKNVLLLIRAQSDESSEQSTTALEREAEKAIGSATEFLASSFRQLRNAARLSLAMSVTMFLVGVAFLVIAAIRSFTDPQTVGTTAVVAGIGIVQLVALFYRHPLRDIARASSNAQQAQMAVMSYILGVALVGESAYNSRSTSGDLRSLSDVTEQALRRLERYTEERPDPADSPNDEGLSSGAAETADYSDGRTSARLHGLANEQ